MRDCVCLATPIHSFTVSSVNERERKNVDRCSIYLVVWVFYSIYYANIVYERVTTRDRSTLDISTRDQKHQVAVSSDTLMLPRSLSLERKKGQLTRVYDLIWSRGSRDARHM